MFTSKEITLLMSLQYNLLLSEDTFVELAEEIELPVDFVLKKADELRKRGVIKRVGANLNYKAFGGMSRAALVGVAVKESRIKEVAAIINKSNPKHNFWREHEKYTIWYTIKARDLQKLKESIKKLMDACNVEEYIILPTKRIYKMDVKYDLIKGVSWSEKGLEPNSIPTVEEIGINAKMLRELESLPITEKPFSHFASYGYKEHELVDLIAELIEKGVVRDFSAVLNEKKIGFRENGMVLVKVEGDVEDVALKLLNNFPQITHLIERTTPDEWRYPLYFMIHAVNKKPIEEIGRKIVKYPEVEDVKILYSKMDLKLGT
jgi:DNA-binding Lrp family transcriptional regulator